MTYSRGKDPKSRNGFKVGHQTFPGTERTQFKPGLLPWNKGNRNLDPIKQKHRTYRFNAKKRGLMFNVPFDRFKELVTGACDYCGEPSTGIDRVDNSLGYIEGNMVPCCGVCNHMKWSLSREAFLQKCRAIITVTGYEI